VAILDEHIAQLNSVADAERRFSKAEATPAPNGTTLVKLCDFVLPPGWQPTRTNVYFLVPAGYPVARPDTFWTDQGVQLASGVRPSNVGNNQPPGIPPGLLWFSWHPAAWNANRDNLVNYVAFIRRRFEEKR
jgi:Prokaryotic E2 family E